MREFIIMKIEVGMASPDMPSSMHKCTHHSSCSQKAFHVKWAHDETKCSSPSNGNSSPSISFLKLHHLFILRQSKKVLLAASSEETYFGLGKNNRMGRHGISMELTMFCQPVCNRSNVLYSMYVGTWNVPKNREEATSLRSLMGNVITKLPTSSIQCDQFWVPLQYSNNRLIYDLGDPCTAG